MGNTGKTPLQFTGCRVILLSDKYIQDGVPVFGRLAAEWGEMPRETVTVKPAQTG